MPFGMKTAEVVIPWVEGAANITAEIQKELGDVTIVTWFPPVPFKYHPPGHSDSLIFCLVSVVYIKTARQGTISS